MVDLVIPSKSKNSDWWRRLIQPSKPTYWLAVARDNGNLEIYFMPDMKLVYIITNVANGNKVILFSLFICRLSHFYFIILGSFRFHGICSTLFGTTK